MAQHDYVIDNQSFPATRTDINNALLAISSTNSGTSAPSTTYASQLWYDTTNNKLYIRNEDNDAWIPLFLLDQSNDKAGTLATEIDIEDASGTNTAGTALTVKGGAGTGSGAGGSIIFQTADGGSSGSSVNAHATRVTITDDGTVQVDNDLSIADKIVHTGDTNTAIRFPAADTVTIETGGSERLRVNSSGKVGIGDTAPTCKLDLGSDVGSSVTDVTNHIGLFGSLYGFGVTSNQLNYVSGDAHVFYNTSGNERVRILSGGGLTFNGDTATANALSDFETGSWVPVYQATSAHPTVTYGLQIGRYTKVGNIVTASCRLSANAASGGSGNLLVGGLPYAALNASPLYYAATVGFSPLWVTAAPQTGILSFNGTQISLITNGSSDARGSLATAITPANMFNGTNGCELIMTITYTSN